MATSSQSSPCDTARKPDIDPSGCSHGGNAIQKYGLAEDITVDRDSLVHAPTAPGLGAQIDFELIERKKVGVLS